MSNDAYAAHSSLEKVPSRTSITKSGGDVEAAHIERVDPDTQYDPKFVRSTIRKIDFRLLPILGALYAFSLIDRTNISLARIIGAGAELKLDQGDRYSIIVLLFFIPYILIEWPSNILIRRVGCALWLGCISVLWGSAMLGMGFVKSWYALAGCRVALGAFEAGFFPGCVYLITTWYIRREQQARLAVFYLLSTLVGGFSPIFAYGVSTIGIAYGLYAWRWLFIICGAITIFLGLLAFLLVVDFPDKATFLTPEQIQFVQNRVQYDRGDAIPDELTWAKARGYLTDPKLWGYAFMFMCSTFPSYAYSLFLPILMVGFGFNVRDSQLLIAPPYAFATVFGVIVAFIADRARMRGPFIIFQSLITIIGLSMTAFLTGTYPRYAGAFLGLFGTSSNIPAVLAWSQNNIIGQSQRAYTSALVIGFGGVGGILAGVLFREKDKPKYLPGLWASIASQIIIIFIASALMAWSWYRNKQARAGGKLIQNRPHFYYTL